MNKTIFELSRKNRELEQRLFREQDKKSSDQFKQLTSQELLGVLQQIFRDTIKAPDLDASPLAHYEIVSAIYKRLTNDKNYHIPGPIKSSLHLTELTFQYLHGITEEHDDIKRLLQLLALSWSQLAVHSPEYLQVKQHPAKLVLSKLLMLGECWDQRSGSLAKKLLDGIRLVLSQLNQKGANPRLYEQACNRIMSLESAFNEYRTKRLKSIVEEKRKLEREAKADLFVTNYIREKTQGEEFPVLLLEFMENYLSPYLKNIFMETGPVGQKWHRAIDDCETLIWSIMAPFTPSFVEEYQEKVPPSLKRLYEQIDELFHGSEGLQDFFYELEGIHIKKLNGERADFHSLITSPLFEDFETNESNPSENDYSKELDELLVDDDWYYLIQKGKRFRCQLVPREYTGKWLVFVNLSGAQIADFDTTSASFHPSQLPLVNIETHNYWDEMTEYLERIMSRRVSVLNEQLQRVEKEQAADKARKQAAEDEARRIIREKIEEELNKQQAKKRKLEEDRAKAIAKAKQEEALLEQRRLKAQKLVDSLMPGAIVSYSPDGQQEQQLTLSIISTTTNKYIFTDQRSQRALDPKETQLIDLFAANRMTLLEQGKEFEDTLQSLVAGQREALKDH
ncbi:DUF1631 family protein [Pleionea mediterranea]|uniref:Uncharacterized protein DUF1631 n=1 Tax=Pleionea mediterranea TaxID=523701 RepID=A0A316FFW3_9GAMM|nr:DUF1631 family protein [Pleionea mediterranea]PWK47821.1 uncharacterized protein DUF1631 [Pleionea mediterranea]